MVDEPVAWDSFVMPAIVVADEPVAVEQPVMEPLEALVAVADVQPFYAADPSQSRTRPRSPTRFCSSNPPWKRSSWPR